jgi:hypothetical protein
MVHLDDLVDFYRRGFAHVLSRVHAKSSTYSRYYIVISTPHTWKDIMAASGDVLIRLWRLEDGAPQSVPISIIPPPRVFYKHPLLRLMSARVHAMLMTCLYPFLRGSLFLGASQNLRGERAKA